jgi:hypothetical protein
VAVPQDVHETEGPETGVSEHVVTTFLVAWAEQHAPGGAQEVGVGEQAALCTVGPDTTVKQLAVTGVLVA